MLILDNGITREIRERDRHNLIGSWDLLKNYIKERPELWLNMNPNDLLWERQENRYSKIPYYRIRYVDDTKLERGLLFTSDIAEDKRLMNYCTIDQILKWCRGYCEKLKSRNYSTAAI